MNKFILILLVACKNDQFILDSDDHTSTSINTSSDTSSSTSVNGGFYASSSSGEGGNNSIQTRLKELKFVGADGSQFPKIGMYDSELNVECYFSRVDSNTYRCFPSNYLTANLYFQDENCNEGLAVSFNECNLIDYAIEFTDVNCGQKFVTKVFEVGQLVEQDILFTKNINGCVEVAKPDGWNFHSLGTTIPMSTFVAGTVEHD